MNAGIDSSFDCVYFGGFSASNTNKISNCYSNVNANIETSISGNYPIGGFVGENQGSVSNCYSTGEIKSLTSGRTGGFVGSNLSGATVSKCFCDVDMRLNDSANVGYFVGNPTDGSTLFKCYYSNDMVVKYYYGDTEITPTVTGGTSATAATLQGADFLFDTLSWNEEVWKTVNLDYPKLAWQE